MPGSHQMHMAARVAFPTPGVYNPILDIFDPYVDSGSGTPRYSRMTIGSGGQWFWFSNGSGSSFSDWALSPAPGVGNGAWIRWTATTVHAQSGSGTFSATSAVLQLSTDRTFEVATTSAVGIADVTYTVQLFSDAAGTVVISTTTIRLTAETF